MDKHEIVTEFWERLKIETTLTVRECESARDCLIKVLTTPENGYIVDKEVMVKVRNSKQPTRILHYSACYCCEGTWCRNQKEDK